VKIEMSTRLFLRGVMTEFIRVFAAKLKWLIDLWEFATPSLLRFAPRLNAMRTKN
jgi:hypothetical protein